MRIYRLLRCQSQKPWQSPALLSVAEGILVGKRALDSVDAVVIATPIATHFELAREALLRGKHVMVEKPLAHSSRPC